ncbi:MAG: choice-of-anchor D domain-containing protein [Gemmatimonadota bacterium]|nr:MAG: choice-of-anchor D domain-containing protein [Gemmatimonadota bacterium]
MRKTVLGIFFFFIVAGSGIIDHGIAQVQKNPNDYLQDATLSVESEAGIPGSTDNVVSIFMNNGVSVYGVQFRLAYNPQVLDVTDVTRTTRTNHVIIFGWGEPEPGIVEVAIADVSAPVAGTSGSIADFHFDVPPSVRCGDFDMTLSNVIITDVSGDSLAGGFDWFDGVFSISLAGREIALSDTEHNFGLVNTGSSAQWDLTIYNDGEDPLEVTNIVSSHPDYTVDMMSFFVGSCDSQQVEVTFSPAAGGIIAGQLTVSSDDPDEPTVQVNLTGEGCVPPEIDTDSVSVYFGEVPLGGFADATIIVYNLGCQTLDVDDVDITGADAMQFSIESGGAPFSVLAGQSEIIEVRFSPTSCGAQTAQLEIDSDDPDEGTIILPLTGDGTSVPNIAVTPLTVDFGVVDVGSVVDTTITVENTGCLDLVVDDVSIDGPDAGNFSIIFGGDPFTLNYGESHDIQIQFEPTAGGSKSGARNPLLAKNATLHVQSNDPDQGVTDIPLAGTECEYPDIQLNLTDVDFGVVNMPQWKDTTIVVSNDSCQTLDVGVTNVVGDDADNFDIIGGGAPFSVATGNTHNIDIRFTPSSDGPKNAVLQIFNTAPGKSPANVNLSGDGCSQPDIDVIPDAGDYGVVDIGSYADKSFYVHNLGCQTLEISSIDLGGDDPTQFSILGDDSFSLAEGDSQEVVVRFEPTSPGAKNAVMQVHSNDPDEGTFNVDLIGGVCGVQDIAGNPLSWDYGKVNLGDDGDKIFTVSNVGCQSLTVTGTALVGADSDQFSYFSGEGGFTLGQGETHDIGIRFSPTSGGNKNATLQINSDDPDEATVEIDLTGEGCESPDIEAEPIVWDFGEVNEGAFAQKIFTISNDSCQTLHVTATDLVGGNSEFTFVSGGGEFWVVPGGTHQIRIQFAPESGGTKSAILRIHSNDPDEDPFNIPLDGEGCEAPDIDVNFTSIDFGAVDGGLSVDTTVTVSNDSCQTLQVTQATITGADAEEFEVVVGGGGFQVPQGQNQPVVVRFAPVNPGAKNAILRITNNDPDEGTKDIPLSGFANAPDIELSATSHNYGNVNLGGFADWVLVVSNVGNKNLSVSNIVSNSADFVITSPVSFPVVIAASGNVNVTVRFTPSTGGTRVANLTITSNDPDEPSRNVSFTGVGCVLPNITVDPTSYNYGKVALGGYKDKTFVVSNIGCQNLNVSSTSITGPDASRYTISSGGGAFTLGKGQTRNVVIRFAPVTGGSKTAIFQIVSNDPDEDTVKVTLQGEGCVSPNIVVDPTTWDFGTVNVGSFSDIIIIVSNTGCQDLVVSGANLVGGNPDQFSIRSGGGGFTVSSGQTRNIEVRFSPTSGGIKNAGVQILSNDPDQGGVIVTLTGRGCPFQDISITPASWDFGIVDLGNYEEKTFVVSNQGCQDLQVLGTNLVGADSDHFDIMSGGGAYSIAGDDTHDVVIRFTPTTSGAKSIVLRITSDDPDEGTYDVTITGGVCSHPDIETNPGSWNYGSVAIGDYEEKTVTVSNTGCQVLSLTGIGLVGANTNQFSITSGNITIDLNHGETHNVVIRFSPTSEGTKSAGLRISSNDPDESTLTVPLNGYGCGDPDIDVDPASVSYGSVNVGSSSDRTITISNVGCQVLNISATTLTGTHATQFDVVSGGGGSTIVSGGARNLIVRFTPTSGGAKTATLQILSDDPDEGTVLVPLTGSGCAEANISLNPLVKNYGTVSVGSSSPGTFVVSNTGCQDLQVTATTILGTNHTQFQIESGGGFFTVGSGLSHNIVVRFVPTSGGFKEATLRILSNDPDQGAVEASLSGTGCSYSDISVNPTSWNFNRIDVGNFNEKVFEVANVGCQNLVVSSTSIVGSDPSQFLIAAGGGGFTLGEGQTHEILIQFVPTSGGSKSAVFQIQSNDPDESIRNISLSGEGCPYQDISVNPTSWNFGTVDIGSFVEKIFVLSNVGCQTLQVTGMNLEGPHMDQFSIVNGDGSFTLVGGETRNVVVRFTPTSGGGKTATLRISSNDPDELGLEVQLSGGVCLGTDITVDPTSLDFGVVNVSLGTQRTAVVSNTGCQLLQVSSVTVTGSDAVHFSVVSGGGSFSIPQGESHNVIVGFVPLSGGGKNAILQILSNDPDEGTKNVPLSGTGCSQPDIAVNPSSWNYSGVAIGDHADKVFIVSNEGCQNLLVSGTTLVGPDASQFAITGGGVFTVVPGGAHSVVVTFSPTSGGVKTASLLIHSNDPDEEEYTVPLTGGALSADIQLSATSHDFDGAPIGQPQYWILEISNVGDGHLTVTSILTDRTDFIVSYPTFPQIVPPGAFVSVAIVFTPSVSGLITGNLTIASNDLDEPTRIVSLRGLGLVPDIELSETRHDFGGVAVGSTTQWILTVTNSGTGDLNVSALGSDNPVFAVDVPSFTVASGGSRLVTVTFSPTAEGLTTGQITVRSNDPDEPVRSVILTGEGLVPDIEVVTSHNFGEVPLGNFGQWTMTVSNMGTGPLIVSGIGSDHPAFTTSPINFTVMPGSSYDAIVTFTPSQGGAASGQITIVSNDPDEGMVVVYVLGNGLVPDISVPVTTYDFGGVDVGDSTTWDFNVQNLGTGDLVVTSILSNKADFIVEPKSFTVPPGAYQVVTVTFLPSIGGLISGQLDISSSDPDEPTVALSLTGTGLEPDIDLSATSHDYNGIPLGQSANWILTVFNVGTGELTVNDIVSSNAAFHVDITSFVVMPSGSRNVTVTLTPPMEGSVSGQLTIYSNDPDEPTVSVMLNGAGLTPDIEIPVTAHDFGNVEVNTSAAWTLLIENVGGADLVVTDVRSDNPAMTVALSLPLILSPRSSEHVPVTFSPTEAVTYEGQLTVTSDDPDEPNITISLTGVGVGVSVHVNNFDVLAYQGVVLLRWSIGAAHDCMGFHLYRSESSDDDYERLTHFLVPLIVNGNYTYRDASITADGTYYYRLGAMDLNGGEEDMGFVVVRVVGFTPSDFGLAQNYPNPFNPDTRITYTLPESERVTLFLYNTLGQKVRALVDEYHASGRYTVLWDGRDDLGRKVASGIYLAVLRSGTRLDSKKMILLK